MSKIALKIYLSLLYLNQPDINIVQIELNQFVFTSTAYFTLRKEMQIEDLYFSFNKYSFKFLFKTKFGHTSWL